MAGVGIAFFYALGMRGLAAWNGNQADDPGTAAPLGRGGSTALTGASTHSPVALVLAALSFTVVAGIVAVGLYVMLASK